jgi:hypothetical protein
MQKPDQPLHIVRMEDSILHTLDHPFCDNPTCPCHEDPELLFDVIQAVEQGLLTPAEATPVVLGMTL